MIWVVIACCLIFGWLLGDVFGWLLGRQFTSLRCPFNWRVFLGPSAYFRWLRGNVRRSAVDQSEPAA